MGKGSEGVASPSWDQGDDHIQLALKLHQETKHQRRTLKTNESIIKSNDSTMESQRNIIVHQDEIIEAKDRKIQSLKDELQSMAARAAAAEALVGKNKKD